MHRGAGCGQQALSAGAVAGAGAAGGGQLLGVVQTTPKSSGWDRPRPEAASRC
jgi:hypothetical protein